MSYLRAVLEVPWHPFFRRPVETIRPTATTQGESGFRQFRIRHRSRECGGWKVAELRRGQRLWRCGGYDFPPPRKRCIRGCRGRAIRTMSFVLQIGGKSPTPMTPASRDQSKSAVFASVCLDPSRSRNSAHQRETTGISEACVGGSWRKGAPSG